MRSQQEKTTEVDQHCNVLLPHVWLTAHHEGCMYDVPIPHVHGCGYRTRIGRQASWFVRTSYAATKLSRLSTNSIAYADANVRPAKTPWTSKVPASTPLSSLISDTFERRPQVVRRTECEWNTGCETPSPCGARVEGRYLRRATVSCTTLARNVIGLQVASK